MREEMEALRAKIRALVTCFCKKCLEDQGRAVMLTSSRGSRHKISTIQSNQSIEIGARILKQGNIPVKCKKSWRSEYSTNRKNRNELFQGLDASRI